MGTPFRSNEGEGFILREEKYWEGGGTPTHPSTVIDRNGQKRRMLPIKESTNPGKGYSSQHNRLWGKCKGTAVLVPSCSKRNLAPKVRENWGKAR